MITDFNSYFELLAALNLTAVGVSRIQIFTNGGGNIVNKQTFFGSILEWLNPGFFNQPERFVSLRSAIQDGGGKFTDALQGSKNIEILKNSWSNQEKMINRFNEVIFSYQAFSICSFISSIYCIAALLIDPLNMENYLHFISIPLIISLVILLSIDSFRLIKNSYELNVAKSLFFVAGLFIITSLIFSFNNTEFNKFNFWCHILIPAFPPVIFISRLVIVSIYTKIHIWIVQMLNKSGLIEDLIRNEIDEFKEDIEELTKND